MEKPIPRLWPPWPISACAPRRHSCMTRWVPGVRSIFTLRIGILQIAEGGQRIAALLGVALILKKLCSVLPDGTGKSVYQKPQGFET
jgi:hypothetical protein